MHRMRRFSWPRPLWSSLRARWSMAATTFLLTSERLIRPRSTECRIRDQRAGPGRRVLGRVERVSRLP